LLVVVLILGVLASVVTISVMNVQQRGRDARRKTDLAEIFKAVGTYQVVNSGNNPLFGAGQALCAEDINHSTGSLYGYYTNWRNLESKISSYMSNGNLPTDPISKCKNGTQEPWDTNSKAGYGYVYFNRPESKDKFSIWTALENESDSDTNSAGGTIGTLDELKVNGKYFKLSHYKFILSRYPTTWKLDNLQNIYGLGTPCTLNATNQCTE